MSDTPLVLRQTDGAIARLTLNRPEKRNALDRQLVARLTEAVERADEDPGIRVIAIGGAGADFCAGADLAELLPMLDAPALENVDDAERLGRLFARLRAARKPVVAMVRGRALGGGCGLATACDLVLAAESARFGYTEVRLGFVPALVLAILGRAIPEKRAFELITLGDQIDARTAESYGLVNRVFPDDDFEAQASAYLSELASRDPAAVRLGKRLLYRQRDMSFEAALGVGAELNALARTSQQLREGVERFLDQRSDSHEERR